MMNIIHEERIPDPIGILGIAIVGNYFVVEIRNSPKCRYLIKEVPNPSMKGLTLSLTLTLIMMRRPGVNSQSLC